MTSAFFASAEGQHEVVNELWFDPIWFGVIAALAFTGLLVFLWTFRNTLALDPHTEHHRGDDDTPTPGHGSSEGGPGPAGGRTSQH